jgi:hypothetical protein
LQESVADQGWGLDASLSSEAMAFLRQDELGNPVADPAEGMLLLVGWGAALRYHPPDTRAWLTVARLDQALCGGSDEAIEQRDEADEAGASDGASQLIPGVRRTSAECHRTSTAKRVAHLGRSEARR